jgi:hypothetical protein
MPKTSAGGLKGGRALYRGPNAYASQGFENDTRRSQLGALAMLYLWGNQSIPTGTSVYTPVAWSSYISSTFTNVFTRGFVLKDNILYCRRTGTYKVSFSVKASLPATNYLDARLQITRLGAATRNYYATLSNSDAATTANVQLVGTPFVTDLLEGDTLVLGLQHNNGGSVTVSGGSVSGDSLTINLTTLLVEEIDLGAPV